MNTSDLGKVKAGKKREDINYNAKIAQLVEHDLAKVGVAGSSPVFRSPKEVVSKVTTSFVFFLVLVMFGSIFFRDKDVDFCLSLVYL